jgi:hypothetical protein
MKVILRTETMEDYQEIAELHTMAFICRARSVGCRNDLCSRRMLRSY